jgi:hypothetical protein
MRQKPYAGPAVFLFALALVLPSCGSDSGSEATAPCPETTPAAASQLDNLPEDLPLDKWGTVTEVSIRAGYVGAEAITDTQIVELYPVLSRHLMSHGFVTVSGENEGFEAEIFFQKSKAPGSFLLREGPCKGDVTIKLLFEIKGAKGA